MDRHEYPDGTEVHDLYVRTVRVGPFVHVSGTTSLGPDGAVVGGDAASQTTATMKKVVAALQRGGATMDDVVRIRIFCTDIADTEAILRSIAPFYGSTRPAATLVGISALADPGLLVEIEAEAVVA